MKIYVIVSKTGVCHGHGDYGDVYALEMIDSYGALPPCPAFKNKKDAENYISDKKKYCQVMELEMI